MFKIGLKMSFLGISAVPVNSSTVLVHQEPLGSPDPFSRDSLISYLKQLASFIFPFFPVGDDVHFEEP